MTTQDSQAEFTPPKSIALESLFLELRNREQGQPGQAELQEFSTELIFKEAKQRAESSFGTTRRLRNISEETHPAIVAASEAVALVLTREHLTFNDNYARFEVNCRSFGDTYRLCAHEPFWDQPVPTFGQPGDTQLKAPAASAFLVAPDLVVTAGHVAQDFVLDEMRFVFDHCNASMPQGPMCFDSENVYAAAALLAHAKTADGSDWALLRLTRGVKNARPLTLTTKRRIDDSAWVYVIGHPRGLPMKIAGAAPVRKNREAAFFLSNLATYRGSSGSPVINADTFEVEGILIASLEKPNDELLPCKPQTCQCFVPCTSNRDCVGRQITRTSEFASVVQFARRR